MVKKSAIIVGIITFLASILILDKWLVDTNMAGIIIRSTAITALIIFVQVVALKAKKSTNN